MKPTMRSPLYIAGVIVLAVFGILYYPAMLPRCTPTASSTTPSVELTERPAVQSKKSMLTPPMFRPLPPWGYNANRNIRRWNALYKSVRSDVDSKGISSFSLVDYGSDQGYFSISFAHFFPDAAVMGVEAGTTGILRRSRTMDVLHIQETYIASLNITNVHICQTFMHHDMFVKLNEAHAVVDYQLVLSVFHWFKLPDREAFEYTLVQLLRNAKTTFLELPTLGDDARIIRAQEGYRLIKKWYDGRSDIETIIREAAAAHQLPIKVTNILEAKWYAYTRIVFRIDVEQNDNAETSIHCDVRRNIYGCANREKHSQCN